MAMLVAAVSGGIPKKPMSTAEVRRALLVPTAVPFACEEQNQKQKKKPSARRMGKGLGGFTFRFTPSLLYVVVYCPAFLSEAQRTASMTRHRVAASSNLRRASDVASDRSRTPVSSPCSIFALFACFPDGCAGFPPLVLFPLAVATAANHRHR